MASFLDKFPIIRYTVDKKLLSEYDVARNLLFRVRVIKEIMNGNLDTYYKYIIKDEETPDDLADKVYGTSTAHWIILYANDIYDPQYDWPMSNRVFAKYIEKKYGSIEFAKTNYHHYEKVITRENPFAQKTSVTTFEVNEEILTDGVLTLTNYSTDYVPGEIVYAGVSNESNTFFGDVISWNNANGQIFIANSFGQVSPFQSLTGLTSNANSTILRIDSPSVPMDAYNTLTDTTDFSTYVVAGKTVFETISRNRITYYDYEQQLNEDRRLIKIIHPRYYQQIINELELLINTPPNYFRRP